MSNNENPTRIHFFIAIGALILAAIGFALTFILKTGGVYTLMASLFLDLGALSFLKTQKKKNNFKGIFYATIVAYILLAVGILMFLGGLIYVAVSG